MYVFVSPHGTHMLTRAQISDGHIELGAANFGSTDAIVTAADSTHSSARPPASPAPLFFATATRSLSASLHTNQDALSSSYLKFGSSSTHPASVSNTLPNASPSPHPSSFPLSSSSPSSPAAASALAKSLKLAPILAGILVPLLLVAALGAASTLYRRRQRLDVERRARAYVWLPGAPARSTSHRSAGTGTGYGSAVLLME
jgi:hypothetical protein